MGEKEGGMEHPGRILIADDEETFLLSTADLLRKEGYECDCVTDAIMAAEKIRSEEYDLLIADVKMEGNVKLELVRELPKMVEYLPVILVTGYPSVRSAVQSIQLSVESYLVKPVDFNELLTQVRSSLKKYRVFCAVRDLRKRLACSTEDLKSIMEVQDVMPRSGAATPLDAFLTLTFKNIVGALSDLKHLTKYYSIGAADQEVCHLLNCPRLTTLKEALQETIDTLERTKSAFKSKELGTLRKKLEGLVEVI
jgi:CheY-like chemotaxis protein